MSTLRRRDYNVTTISRVLEQLDADDRLQYLAAANRGIEREGLRTGQDGRLAPTPHPAALGSALCHPYLTTDFAEALLELISPVRESPTRSIGFMQQLHGWLVEALQAERLWPASMPCILPDAGDIAIARYGSSNVARMKEVYREGLSWRYGRPMQTIAGIHYNFSPPEGFWATGTAGRDLQQTRSDGYMGLVRNFQRHAWLLLYLFGASPALDRSFLQGRSHDLDTIGPSTLGLRHATSLRMGDLGYQNNAQASLNVCYNTLPTYLDSLRDAISTSLAEYERIGIVVDGSYRQLNSNILQIENEYYSAIRPKRVTAPGERPIRALRERGIEYVEIRCLDVDPFLPLGIDAVTTRFLDLFLWYCLLADSPSLSSAECGQAQARQAQVVRSGRDPGLRLEIGDKTLTLPAAASTLLDELEQLAGCLQSLDPDEDYLASIRSQREKVEDPQRTPSGRMLAEIEADGSDFVDLGIALADEHRQTLLASPADHALREVLDAAVGSSRQQQQAIEADSAGVSFEDYLANYFSQA